MFSIMIYNPSFPKDKSKAKALSKAQLAEVHDYIVAGMNGEHKLKDAEIIQRLAAAGDPVVFD